MTRTAHHRVVVVGCGDVGAAALHRLSRALGSGVVGLDATAPDAGDQSVGCAVGLVQGADPEARLAAEAYPAWREVERLSGQALLTETGGLLVAADPGEDPDAAGAAALADHVRAADRADLDFTVLEASAIAARWPQFRLRGGERALHQRRGGILDAARGRATHLALARAQGADTVTDTPVRALRPGAGHVEVVTDDAVLRAAHVVLTAGAAGVDLLAGCAPALAGLRPRTTAVASCATPHLLDFSPTRFAPFTWVGASTVSGLPVHGSAGTTLTLPADGDAAAFVAAHLPGFAGPRRTTTRTVTTTRDGRAVLGAVDPRVSVAAGTGAHPLLAPVLGRALADLATTGRTRRPVAALAPERTARAAVRG